MIITIQLQSPEELDWIQPLLLQLQEKQVNVSLQMPTREPQIEDSFNPQALLRAVERAAARRTFRKISDPVEWQKKLRDEWN